MFCVWLTKRHVLRLGCGARILSERRSHHQTTTREFTINVCTNTFSLLSLLTLDKMTAKRNSRARQLKSARSCRRVEKPKVVPVNLKVTNAASPTPSRHSPTSSSTQDINSASVLRKTQTNPAAIPIRSVEHWLDLDGEEDLSEVEMSEAEEEMDSTVQLAGSSRVFNDAFKKLMDSAQR